VARGFSLARASVLQIIFLTQPLRYLVDPSLGLGDAVRRRSGDNSMPTGGTGVNVQPNTGKGHFIRDHFGEFARRLLWLSHSDDFLLARLDARLALP
jgi:hypothetical protein